MNRNITVTLCTLVAGASFAAPGLAQPIMTVSLDIFYANAADSSNGGTWQLLAKASHEGLAGLSTQLLGTTGPADAVFMAPTPAFKTVFDGDSWKDDSDSNPATLDMLFGQVPVAAPGPQDLQYGVGVTTDNPDELGAVVFPGATNMNHAVLLAFGQFPAGASPSFVANRTFANMFTVRGTTTNPPPVSTIRAATVTTQVRNNVATIPGDADLNKTVDSNDLTILETHFGQSNRLWQQGDFTGDKLVNQDDLNALRNSFLNQSGDFNNNSVVDAADYVVWRKNNGTPGGYNESRGQLRPRPRQRCGDTLCQSTLYWSSCRNRQHWCC